ncbi:MAG: hypothetical protein MJ244_06825 [Clostridia bacterium]|nr:hypothetical protein [Clostridia bacterium]
MKISPDKLQKEISKQLTFYNKEVAKDIKKAVEDVANETKDVIDSHITFNNRTGDYKNAMNVKTVKESEFVIEKKWYVEAPHYRLTHLLEKGHKKRNGKTPKTRAYPHIKYGDQYAKKELPKRIEEVIRKNGN